MGFETIIKRLQDGPAILFLGQRYLSQESGKDYFLEKIITKYGHEIPKTDYTYQIITQLGLSNYGPEIFQWMQGLCKSISTPFWLEEIAKFPWAAIYTSTYDTILERAFASDARSVQPIVNDRFLVRDPRNKHKLHITYLLGSITTAQQSDLPPLRELDMSRRNSVINSLLNRLPTMITPRGVLVIEGYGHHDQLSIDDLYSYISSLGDDQVLICSADEELIQNDKILDLIESGKVQVSSDSFAMLLSQWVSEGRLKFDEYDSENYYGKWITLPHDRLKIPEDIVSKVSKNAFVVDDSVFLGDIYKGVDEHYDNFRHFLSSTNVLPDWEGYEQGFAFERDFYEKLKSTVVNTYTNREASEKPIILFGQTSSGKTVSLGLLTYELRKEYKYPVLFIPKRYQRADEMSLDLFCRWAEDNKAKYTVIVWDGMLDVEPYYKLLRFLNSRGRNVILVCSCYITELDADKPRPNNYIEAPIDLTASEKGRFVSYLKSINSLLANVIQSTDEPNLLALLYRYLPANLANIRSGLHDEYRFFVNQLSGHQSHELRTKTDLYELLTQAGFISSEDYDDEYLKRPLLLASETITIADFLIFSVMVPGQHGLNVPFELLLNAIGFDAFSTHIFKAIKDVHLIKWYDDEEGNIELGPRTTLEAKILARYAGGKRSEIGYIVGLLERVKTEHGSEFGATDRQVEFAVQLLSEIGPNSTDAYAHSYYEITNVLRDLRIGRSAYHPRLVLKEALFLRSIVKKRKDLSEVEETNIDLLLRAEEIVRQALDDLGAGSGRIIASYLRVELSTICGFLAQHFIHDPETAKDYYWQVRQLNNHSFTTNPGNYRAVDIAAWTTERLLEARIFSEEEKIEAETDLLSLFEMVEAEGVSEEHIQDFQARKIRIYEIIGKTSLADEVFEAMRKKGFTYGIYLRAKKKLGLDSGFGSSREQILAKNQEAFSYLYNYFDEIKYDGRCLFLLLKTWWTSKTSANFFEEEKQVVDFNRSDWDFCLQITGLLLACDDKFHTGTVYYLHAVSQFHLDFIRPAMDTFARLQAESLSYGRKRIAKYYMLALPSGGLRVFSGEVKENVSRSKHEKRGDIYIAELGLSIPFSLFDFRQNSFQKGEKVTNFHIAFNFLGPIAVPVTY